jgi:ParB/RepB/Spo0J family partition protein
MAVSPNTLAQDVADDGEAPTVTGTVRIEWPVLAEPYGRLRVHDVVAESKLAAAIAQQGQQCAVLVVVSSEPQSEGRYVLVDGYRRARILRRLGHDTIAATVLGLEETEALAYCHRQETGRHRSAIEEGWLVRELIETHGRSPTSVSASLGRTPSWVSRRLGLVRNLPAEVEEAVRRGMVPPHAAMKSLLPLARANAATCVKLVAALGSERVTTRQVALLYDAWRRGDAEQRRRIIEAPRMLLAAAEAATPREAKGPRRDDDAGRLAKELGTAASLVWRAKSTLERAVIIDRWVRRDESVVRAFRRVTDAYAALSRRFEDGGQDGH